MATRAAKVSGRRMMHGCAGRGNSQHSSIRVRGGPSARRPELKEHKSIRDDPSSSRTPFDVPRFTKLVEIPMRR